MTRGIALALAVAIAVPMHAAAETNPVPIEEWEVPYPDSRPRDPDAVSASEVWFVGQVGDYLARLNPQTGDFRQHSFDSDVGPHNLIVGDDGIVWYAGNLQGYIGRYDPATEKITRIEMPDPGAVDPHTLVFDAGQEHIFFTVQGGNFVGRLTVATQEVELVEVPTRGARPYGIKVAPDGTAWVALFGTNKLAEVDPKTLSLTEHELPWADARPRRLGVLSNGQVYYTDYRRGTLGHFDPGTRAAEEWQMPSGERSRPYGMAIDARDRVWFVETGPSPNAFVGFAPDAEAFFSITPIPSGAGSVRHMDHHAPTGTIWFGTDANTIGRAKVGE